MTANKYDIFFFRNKCLIGRILFLGDFFNGQIPQDFSSLDKSFKIKKLTSIPLQK